MKPHWPTVPLGEVIRQRKEFIRIDDMQTYKRPRVQLHAKGIIERDVVTGAEIKTKTQQVCRAGEFLVAEIDAKVGGFGVVPENLDGAIVSSHYFLFQIDETKLDRQFLDFYSRTPAFREQVEAQGSTNYAAIRPAHVLGYTIPLPPVTEQRRIVARIEQLAAQIEEARRLRHQATEETDALLPASRAKCMSDLLDEYDGECLGELISMASGEGLTSSEMDDSYEFPVYGGGGLNGRYSRYLFEESKIAIGRVGARCGCVFITEPKSWITDNALYLTEISDRLDHKFLVHALSNLDLRQQANQAAQPVVSQKKINPMEIPVPPLPEQRRIVGYLDGLAGQVAALARLQSETAAELDALLPSILDKAFKGEL
jgi:type I restriction enzyme S subunit